MNKSMQDSLCKGLRAAGIPKEQAHTLQNIFTKWYDASGAEWTNQRIKDLRQWYETCLAGEPNPPEWFKHSKDGYPLGIWNWVFKLPIPKALACLSMNTILYEKDLSDKQKEKFLHALEGNGTQDRKALETLVKYGTIHIRTGPMRLPKMESPTIFDMNGSIPIHDGHTCLRPKENLGKAMQALVESWKSVPDVTYRFLDEQDHLGYMPWPLVFDKFGYFVKPKLDKCVGRVSVIQESQLKARIVGNPNRVVQKTLEPLQYLYQETLRSLETDVTHAQELGIAWAQKQLQNGVTLAGSDLTSASDLLDIDLCLYLVNSVFGFDQIPGYQDYTDYLLEVSRSPWFCKALNCEVQWKQGSVLGTNPSFGLLSLTNNAAGLVAISMAKGARHLPMEVSYFDCFRAVGDDIIMRAEIAPWYNAVIQSLGGEINLSKTITSDKVAEFAGRVITPKGYYLKKVNYCEPSDNSFMSILSQLGYQAKYFLRPRQNKVADFYQYIPGFVVDGPWIQDSYGEPLDSRYSWYLECVQPVLGREEPDLPEELMEMSLLRALLDVQQQGGTVDISYVEPAYDEGYLPSVTHTRFKSGGDPRLTNGKTLLETLESHLKDGSITPYKVWKQEKYSKDVWEPQTPKSDPNTPDKGIEVDQDR